MSSRYFQTCAISGLPIQCGSDVVFLFLSQPLYDGVYRNWNIASPPIFLKADETFNLHSYFGNIFHDDKYHDKERELLSNQPGWKLIRNLCVNKEGKQDHDWYRDCWHGGSGFRTISFTKETNIKQIFPWVCLRSAWDAILKACPENLEVVKQSFGNIAKKQMADIARYDELIAQAEKFPRESKEFNEFYNPAWFKIRLNYPACFRHIEGLPGDVEMSQELLSVICDFDQNRLSPEVLNEIIPLLAEAAFVYVALQTYMGITVHPQLHGPAYCGWGHEELLAFHEALSKHNAKAIKAGKAIARKEERESL